MKLLAALLKKKIIITASCAVVIIALTVLAFTLPRSGVDDVEETTAAELPVQAEPLPRLQIVYFDEDIAERSAISLAERLSARFADSAEAFAVPYGEEQEGAVLTVRFGSAAESGEDALEDYMRLGVDGFSIEKNDNGAKVTFFSEAGADAAAERVERLICEQDGFFSLESYESERKSEQSALHRMIDIGADELCVLCVSYPDTDSYSLRALSLLLEHSGARLVIFNGGLSCGASDRGELAEAWSAIGALLAERKASFIFLPSAFEELPITMLCEVIGGVDGCLNGGDAEALTICGGGAVLANLLLAPSSAEDVPTSLVDEVSAVSGVPFSVVTPSSPEPLCELLLPLSATAALGEVVKGDAIDELCAANAEYFICGGATNSLGAVLDADDGLPDAVLCGSIGFLKDGLGGRFDHHHSLRGGVLFKATADERSLRYLYAAEYGALER